jgi:hypothetical protein
VVEHGGWWWQWINSHDCWKTPLMSRHEKTPTVRQGLIQWLSKVPVSSRSWVVGNVGASRLPPVPVLIAAQWTRLTINVSIAERGQRRAIWLVPWSKYIYVDVTESTPYFDKFVLFTVVPIDLGDKY